MRCTECPDYRECRRKYDLRRYRRRCPKAKTENGKDVVLQKALDMIAREYEKAKKQEFVRNPLAYALYKVWGMVDQQPAGEDAL